MDVEEDVKQSICYNAVKGGFEQMNYSIGLHTDAQPTTIKDVRVVNQRGCILC
jgi:hypothetical protein